MKRIEELCDFIEEEIHDAKKYADRALFYKDTDPELAKRYYDTSLQEMEHMNNFHKDVIREIEEYRKKNGEPPQEMMWRYEYLHKRHIAAAGEVKALQLLFKEG